MNEDWIKSEHRPNRRHENAGIEDTDRKERSPDRDRSRSRSHDRDRYSYRDSEPESRSELEAELIPSLDLRRARERREAEAPRNRVEGNPPAHEYHLDDNYYPGRRDRRHSRYDSSTSYLSVDSLDVRLVEFQKDAAIASVERFDLNEAEQIVRDILAADLAVNVSIERGVGIGVWVIALAELLLWQQKVEEASQLLRDKYAEDSPYAGHVKVRVEHALGNFDVAKRECANLIKSTRKSNDPETRKQSLD